MSLDNFIPELWAASNLKYQDKKLVFKNIVNTDYEGDISAFGDTVHINQLGPVTTFDYVKNVDMTAAETLTDSTQILQITESRGFNIQIDDVDKAQQNPKLMSEAMKRAGYALADDKDQFIASLFTGVDASMIVGLGNDTTPLVVNAANVYETFVTASVLLDEANVETMDRWVVIPSYLHGEILKSTEYTSASALGDEVKVNGRVGKIAGFDIYLSNNVVNVAGTKYKVMFGTNEAITFADQLQKITPYTPELRHGDAVKGLDLYGGKLVQSKGIALGTFNKA